MNSSFISTNEIRLRFTKAMSEMYQEEVPLYRQLLSLANSVNKKVINDKLIVNDDVRLLELEHHGAIRVGTAEELFTFRRVFAVMGMQPVDYYDLSATGIPVHSTAFRAIEQTDLLESPFRVFCSLLRLELIDNDALKNQADSILSKRDIFPEKLLELTELFEKQGGLSLEQTNSFIENAIDVFRWHENATVDKLTYDQLKGAHGLVADVVSFKGPHINHLTPKILDIDECQQQLTKNNIKAKAFVEGPPKRRCPILLRQTSFVAIEEKITFSDEVVGSHTARFGEVEERGIALTPKGRELYDRLLNKAKNENPEINYTTRLKDAFTEFPDSYKELRQQGLAYFHYSIKPNKQDLKKMDVDIEALIETGVVKAEAIKYEDFLPVSAAGIFSSNLSGMNNNTNVHITENTASSLDSFEKALGVSVFNSFEIYNKQQTESLAKVAAFL